MQSTPLWSALRRRRARQRHNLPKTPDNNRENAPREGSRGEGGGSRFQQACGGRWVWGRFFRPPDFRMSLVFRKIYGNFYGTYPGTQGTKKRPFFFRPWTPSPENGHRQPSKGKGQKKLTFFLPPARKARQEAGYSYVSKSFRVFLQPSANLRHDAAHFLVGGSRAQKTVVFLPLALGGWRRRPLACVPG